MINYMTNEEVELTHSMILTALKAIKEDSTYRISGIGICGCVRAYYLNRDGLISNVRDQFVIEKLIEGWPKHSGVMEFPISVGKIGPWKKYVQCDNKWNHKTEYGRLRWELLEWLINKLENENAHQSSR